MKKRKWK